MREQEALTRIQGLQHDLLLPVQLILAGPGCLIAVSELVETSLRDRFQEAAQPGRGGFVAQPAARLALDHRRGTDELLQEQNLTHLGLHPRSLLFKGNRLQMADFGLLPLLWQPAGLLQSQLQPRYAAPEVLEMRGGPGSDQYSLAVIYQEMLTGEPPFRGRRPVSHGGVGSEPNLRPLPAADQPVLARALNPDPERRFASNVEFIEVLDQAGLGKSAGARPVDGGASSREILAELMAESGSRVNVPSRPPG